MTTQEEIQHIHTLLPLLQKQAWGYDLFEYQEDHPELKDNDILLLGTRLKEEGLATNDAKSYTYYITSKGAGIAREPSGYVGTLAQAQERQQTEESRAKKNVAGTFGSFIVAGLALAFALYTYFATSQDTGALEKKVQTLEQRLRALEQQRQSHDAHAH